MDEGMGQKVVVRQEAKPFMPYFSLQEGDAGKYGKLKRAWLA